MTRPARPQIATLAAGLLLFLLASCAEAPNPIAPPVSGAHLALAPVSYAALPGWGADKIAAALPAFRRSCAQLAKRAPDAAVGPAALHSSAGDWRQACAAAARLPVPADDATARRFFEDNFTPYAATADSGADGLFTGYYEPEVAGARQRGGAYTVPILKRPGDLVMVDLGRFRPAWRGERIAGRVVAGSLVPYDSRKAIEAGSLDREHLALFWAKDPVAVFFLQIQGSGRIGLPDGSQVRLGYDGQNGQPYVAIGKLLVQRGQLTSQEVSLATIRAWIKAHPQAGTALMDENPSYVFFKEQPGDGPIGAEGVVLTPGRSLAVDPGFIPLGAPLWLDVDDRGTPLRRLMIAQDTGGAIRGPVRGDVFWGFGPEAEARAGVMRASGGYYLLLPRTISPPRLVVGR